MTPDDLARLERDVETQAGRTLGACIRVMPGQLAELLRVYRIWNEAEAAAGKPT